MHVAVDDHVNHRGGLWLCRGQQHSVDHVNHTIVCDDIGHGDLGIVDEDAIAVDRDGDVGSVQCGGGSTVGEVCREHLSSHHVVKEDVGELWQCQEVFSGGVERSSQCQEGIVGRGEYGEGPFSRKGACQVGFNNGCLEEVVYRTVHDDIHYSCRVVGFHDDGADHTFMFGIVAHSIFEVVYSRNVKSDGAHAIVEEPPRITGRQTEGYWIVKIFASEAGFSIDAVPTTIIGKRHRFTNLYGQFRRMNFVVVDGNVVVSVALGE